ncbi:MAG: hypothetical protein QOG65_1823 [Actinomycetota bacterium]|nr:hypothetical protein [Actinomycetota bacterium]
MIRALGKTHRRCGYVSRTKPDSTLRPTHVQTRLADSRVSLPTSGLRVGGEPGVFVGRLDELGAGRFDCFLRSLDQDQRSAIHLTGGRDDLSATTNLQAQENEIENDRSNDEEDDHSKSFGAR